MQGYFIMLALLVIAIGLIAFSMWQSGRSKDDGYREVARVSTPSGPIIALAPAQPAIQQPQTAAPASPGFSWESLLAPAVAGLAPSFGNLLSSWFGGSPDARAVASAGGGFEGYQGNSAQIAQQRSTSLLNVPSLMGSTPGYAGGSALPYAGRGGD